MDAGEGAGQRVAGSDAGDVRDDYYRIGPLILGRKPQHVLVPTGSRSLDALLGGGLRSGLLTVLQDSKLDRFSCELYPLVTSGKFCYFAMAGPSVIFHKHHGSEARKVDRKTARVVSTRTNGTLGLIDYRPMGADDLYALAEIARDLNIPVVALVSVVNKVCQKWEHVPPGSLVYGAPGTEKEVS